VANQLFQHELSAVLTDNPAPGQAPTNDGFVVNFKAAIASDFAMGKTNEFSPPRREAHGMDNASDADLKQLVEDPEDAPLVEAAAEESDEKAAPPTSP
jgi:hypothetical protein